jgi:hypothetical protein
MGGNTVNESEMRKLIKKFDVWCAKNYTQDEENLRSFFKKTYPFSEIGLSFFMGFAAGYLLGKSECEEETE